MWLARMNPFQKPGLTPILEPLSSSSPRPPVPLPQAPSLPLMSFEAPLPLQHQTLPSDFADSRWSEEASQGLPLPTKLYSPVTILGVPMQLNLLFMTQTTSGTLSHPAPFYPSVPSFLQGNKPLNPASGMLSTRAYSTGISQYPAPSMPKSPLMKVLSQPPTARSQPQSQNPSLVHPDPHSDESLSQKEQRLEED